jgi:AmmeMemoRadiSam system protein B/AmmeMemoRadiSam system protein A
MSSTSAVRPAAVAGMFYPREARSLRDSVDAYLSAGPVGATPPVVPTAVRPKLLIVPHAGYVYSGPVAGQAYARLRPHAAAIRRVVLLGPAHRVALRGLALPAHDAFETPLGRVAIDPSARAALAGLAQVGVSAAAHADEHSLEVQLPFLQRVLGDGFVLVPLVVGQTGPREVAEVLERLWGGDETLIVISSDLSHYLPYADAQARDRRTVERIGAGATDLDVHDACGAHALNGALLAAGHHGLRPVLLNHCNSGDTAGDRRRVVGYAAFAAGTGRTAARLADDETGERDESNESDESARPADAAGAADAVLGLALLSRAHNTIAARLGRAGGPEPGHPALAEPGATFVTLSEPDGRLRGCIGRLVPDASLEVDVRRNAQAAAFGDPRFAPLAAHEWPGLRLSVSLLGPHEPLPWQPDAASAARALRPGRDGVVLAWRGRRATFLPQVWAQLPEPDEFVAALLHKAGLREGFWAEDLTLARYEVVHFEGTAVEGGLA